MITLPAESPVQPTPAEETPATEYPYAYVELRFTPEEALMVAQTIYGEAGVCSYEERRLVAWCICNRVDSGIWGDTISEVVNPGQFHGYDPDCEVADEYLAIAWEVLTEWSMEEEADILEPYAPTPEYLYFRGDGRHNWFREEY